MPGLQRFHNPTCDYNNGGKSQWAVVSGQWLVVSWVMAMLIHVTILHTRWPAALSRIFRGTGTPSAVVCILQPGLNRSFTLPSIG